MSDPFDNINNEVYLEKIKGLFYKFKVWIISTIILLVLVSLTITFYSNYKKKEVITISDYYIKILSIIDEDPNRAKDELKKLAKLNNKNYQKLSNLLVFKLSFESKNYVEALKSLDIIKKNTKSNNDMNKVLDYYYAQVYLEQNNIENFNFHIGELLSYSGMWALLAHELRGHLYFSKKEYDNALKNFNKIVNNQQASMPIKNRALEMIDSITLYYEKDS